MRILIFILCLTLAFWLASCNPIIPNTEKTDGIIDNTFTSTTIEYYKIDMKTVVNSEGCTWVLGIVKGDGDALQMQHSPCCKNPNHAK